MILEQLKSKEKILLIYYLIPPKPPSYLLQWFFSAFGYMDVHLET